MNNDQLSDKQALFVYLVLIPFVAVTSHFSQTAVIFWFIVVGLYAVYKTII